MDVPSVLVAEDEKIIFEETVGGETIIQERLLLLFLILTLSATILGDFVNISGLFQVGGLRSHVGGIDKAILSFPCIWPLTAPQTEL